MIVIILFTAGTSLAQSNDTKPLPPPEPLTTTTTEVQTQQPMNPIARAMSEARRRRQEAPQGAQAMKPPSTQVQVFKPVSSPTRVMSSAVPVEDNRNQLVRNLPYQPVKTTPTQTSSSQPVLSETSNASRVVACVVNGFERNGMSSADCKAQGGREIRTAEVLKSDINGKNR
jgi:hypothetical protein